MSIGWRTREPEHGDEGRNQKKLPCHDIAPCDDTEIIKPCIHSVCATLRPRPV